MFAIKNSTTIILPQWFTILQDLELDERMMPRDVSTQWNLTFDMLNFAVEHIAAINTITSDRDMKLRKYELSEDDWDIARQLRDVLKVRIQFGLFIFNNHSTSSGIQGCDTLLFPRSTKTSRVA